MEQRSPSKQTQNSADAVPVFDRASVREVDRAAIDEYGIPGLVLMENAARGLVNHAMKMLDRRQSTPARVLIVCGSGNNGGDGYAAARHLHNRGIKVVIAMVGEPSPESDAGINRAICGQMNLRERPWDEVMHRADCGAFDLVIDAIFGTGLDREVTGPAADAIAWINSSGVAVLAADVPSGMDCDTGQPLGTCIKASATVTFVGVKLGFLEPGATAWLGEIVVADIGAPRELIERFGQRVGTARHR